MRMGVGSGHGRYVVPARALEALLDAATSAVSDGASYRNCL
jgi:hypothetical protein